MAFFPLRRRLFSIVVPSIVLAIFALRAPTKASADSVQRTVDGEELASGPHPQSGGKEVTTGHPSSTEERQLSALLEVSEVPRGVGAPVASGGIGVATGRPAAGPLGVPTGADTSRPARNDEQNGGAWKRSGLSGSSRARGRSSLSPLFPPDNLKKETTSFFERFIRRPIQNLGSKFERWAHLNDGITSLLGPATSQQTQPQQAQRNQNQQERWSQQHHPNEEDDVAPTGATSSTLQKKSDLLDSGTAPTESYQESDLRQLVLAKGTTQNINFFGKWVILYTSDVVPAIPPRPLPPPLPYTKS